MTALDELAGAVVLSFPPVRDQGPRSTCAAFAATAAHEHSCRPPAPLSEEHAFWAGRHPADLDVAGAAVADVLQGLSGDGQLTADQWPYGAPPPPSHPDGPGAAAGCPLPEWEQLPDCRYATVRELLDAGSPVILTVAFAPDVWFSAAGGRLEHDPAAPVFGAHAVLAVAAADGAAGPAVLVRNSWGSAWGRAGYAWTPAALLDAHGLVAHTVTAVRAA